MIGDFLQPTHLIFIFVVALLVLGPKRLPEVGRSLGKGIRDFRGAMAGLDEHVNEATGVNAFSATAPTAPATPVTPATVAVTEEQNSTAVASAPVAVAETSAPVATASDAPTVQATAVAAHDLQVAAQPPPEAIVEAMPSTAGAIADEPHPDEYAD